MARITETMTFHFSDEHQQRRFHERLRGKPLSSGDALILFNGLVHDSIMANDLTPEARTEITDALDKILAITAN